MRKWVSECVICPAELGCIGDLCPHKKVMKYICDTCGNDTAEYHIEGEDYCEPCAIAFLQELFDTMDVTEKAKLLDVRIENIHR